MRTSIGKVVGTVAVGLVLLTGCAGQASTNATPVPTLPAVQASDRVVADAKIVPVQTASLNFQTTGYVDELLVKEGDTVEKDAPLARLDTRELELKVEQARVEVSRAKANYDKLVEGATPEEVAAAQAAVNQAQAGLRQTQGGVTQSDVAAARSQLESARAALAQLEAGPKTTEVERAKANLDQARSSAQTQRDALSQAKTNAKLALDQAANTLRNAQDSFSRTYWDNRNLENELGKYGKELPQENKDAEASAQRAVQNAETSVEQARVAYEQAQLAERTGIETVETRIRDAQAALDQLLAGADKDQLAAARARVAQAQADLNKLLGDQRAGQVQAANAGVQSAQANLEKVTAKPRQTDLSIADAQVRAAEVTLKEAELALDRAILRAPFAGTVAEVNLKIGELPSTTSAAIVVADFSSWQIETSDLTELSVVKIKDGDPVAITFDALPGFELAGTVTRIKPIGKNNQGDMTYTVVVTPENWDDRLRWNMTASVAIESAK